MTSSAPLPGRSFHGGISGLRPGDLLTPHEPNYVDGCPICTAKAAGRQPHVPGLGIVDPLTERPDRVYLTSDREYAFWYASLYPRGDLYVVEPVGDIEPSTEDLFPSWAVEAARVRTVYSRYVQLTDRQRRALSRRWTALDFARQAVTSGVRHGPGARWRAGRELCARPPHVPADELAQDARTGASALGVLSACGGFEGHPLVIRRPELAGQVVLALFLRAHSAEGSRRGHKGQAMRRVLWPQHTPLTRLFCGHKRLSVVATKIHLVAERRHT